MNELDQAYQAGRHARERGAGEFDNRLYGITPESGDLRKKRREGWRDEDSLRKKNAK